MIGISRLSIVDISHETQPFSIDEINITVVFNGEIYNYKSLRDHLSSKGIKLLGYSEIEVIANLYKLYSEKFSFDYTSIKAKNILEKRFNASNSLIKKELGIEFQESNYLQDLDFYLASKVISVN